MFAETVPQFARSAAQAGRDAQIDYLGGRLREAERATSDARAQAARLAGEPQAQTARAALLARELAASQTALAEQQRTLTGLTEELKGQRLFAMQSIEMGRSENAGRVGRQARSLPRWARCRLLLGGRSRGRSRRVVPRGSGWRRGSGCLLGSLGAG